MEINGEGVKCKVCLDGGDNLSIWWSIWTVEIDVKCKDYLDGGDKLSVIYLDYLDGVKCKVYLDGGDKLSIWTVWTVEINYLDGGDKYGRW